MGWLSTHVLNTATGCPATGMIISLWRLELQTDLSSQQCPKRQLLKTVTTNQSGRTDEALLKDESFVVGQYELLFEVGRYFAGQGLELAHPSFLTDVPIRFCIADAASHYHVPLLVTPWSYSTYRGS